MLYKVNSWLRLKRTKIDFAEEAIHVFTKATYQECVDVRQEAIMLVYTIGKVRSVKLMWVGVLLVALWIFLGLGLPSFPPVLHAIAGLGIVLVCVSLFVCEIVRSAGKKSKLWDSAEKLHEYTGLWPIASRKEMIRRLRTLAYRADMGNHPRTSFFEARACATKFYKDLPKVEKLFPERKQVSY